MKEIELTRPSYYQKGERDLFDEWRARYPQDVFTAIMLSHAQKYLTRMGKKTPDPVVDLNKAIECLTRLREGLLDN